MVFWFTATLFGPPGLRRKGSNRLLARHLFLMNRPQVRGNSPQRLAVLGTGNPLSMEYKNRFLQSPVFVVLGCGVGQAMEERQHS